MKPILLFVLCALLMGCASLMDSLDTEGLEHKWMGSTFSNFYVVWGNPDYTYYAPLGESNFKTYHVYFKHRDNRSEVVVVETNQYEKITSLKRMFFPDEK